MKLGTVLIISALAAAFLGCGKRDHKHFVIMPDISGSIDRQSLEQAFKAIDELTSHLDRGDILTIIPIRGEADAEAPGQIMRFEVPVNRQAYDLGRRQFEARLRIGLENLQRSALRYPGLQTDIFGTISLAQQEIQLDHNSTKDILVILSDFVEEDDDINFNSDQRLTNPNKAKAFATEAAARKSNTDLRGTSVCLGLLRSREYTNLNPSRREAVRVFWTSYFDLLHSRAIFSADGPGLLTRLQNIVEQ